MTQHFYYFSPQTPGADRWTVDLGTDAIRLGDIPGWATAAENGDVAQNGVAIDDPTGNAGYLGDSILGLKTFYVEEDYCAPYGADGVNGTRLWTGYIRERRYRRGNQSPSTSLLTGVARRIDIGLEDLNSLAAFRIVGDPSGVRDAAHGNRPAETDVARIQWLIGTVYLPVTNDAGWIDTTNPVNMDANDYTGASAADVIHDCATASGKDWWIGYWEATGTDSLWYADSMTSTAYTSLLSLTDDIADLTLNSAGEVDPTSTVWPVMPDAELLRDPTFTYAGLYEPYANGYIIAQQATTANTYAWRDGTAPNSNVKTAAKANAIATRLLAQDSTEQDRITCRVQLPASLATGIKAGQRLQFRSQFMPGYQASVRWPWMRVKRCTVAQDEETDQRYTLLLELTPQTPVPFYGDATLIAYRCGTGDNRLDTSLWASDDNVAWHQVVATSDWLGGGLAYFPIPNGERNHRYWQMRTSWTSLGGYDGGTTYANAALWAATPAPVTYFGSSFGGTPPVSPPSADGDYAIDGSLDVVWVGQGGSWVGTWASLWDGIPMTAVRLTGSLGVYGNGTVFGPGGSATGWGVLAGVVPSELETFTYSIELPAL